jgi:hypothetical protein
MNPLPLVALPALDPAAFDELLPLLLDTLLGERPRADEPWKRWLSFCAEFPAQDRSYLELLEERYRR